MAENMKKWPQTETGSQTDAFTLNFECAGPTKKFAE